MIAKLEWTQSNAQQNIEQLQNPTMGVKFEYLPYMVMATILSFYLDHIVIFKYEFRVQFALLLLRKMLMIY